MRIDKTGLKRRRRGRKRSKSGGKVDKGRRRETRLFRNKQIAPIVV